MKFIPDFSVRNPVAVNLLMFALIGGGIFFMLTLRREFFPPSDPEVIVASVAYPGSTPEEVVDGVTKRIEDAIADVSGIDRYYSNTVEGLGIVIIEVDRYSDKKKVFDDVDAAIDSIDDFPEDAEEPRVVDIELRSPVITVVVFGEASDRRLTEVAKDLQDHMRRELKVSGTSIVGARQPELAVDVAPAALDQYNVTFDDVARAIGGGNIDVPGGEIKSSDGAILVRTLGKQDDVERIENIIVRASPDGSRVRVADVATVRDTFADVETLGLYKGKRAVSIIVFKNTDQDAIRISRAVRDYIDVASAEYAGEAIQIEYRADASRFIRQRQELLARNGIQGFVLVFLCLLLFLERRVAFWAAAGLPVSFLGTFILMYLLGVSINMISLFGLIIVVGLIVDDAIIIGENIYRFYEEGKPPHLAAIEGAQQVVYPVISAILTTIFAFLPLLYLEGVVGDFLGVLPLVVICALLVSLLEALVILPSHLAESLERKHELEDKRARKRAARGARGGAMGGGDSAPAGFLRARYAAIGRLFDGIGDLKQRYLGEGLTSLYIRLMERALEWRYVFIAGMVCFTFLSFGLLASGFIQFVFIQDTDSEVVTADIEMAAGTNAARTMEVCRTLEATARTFAEVEGAFAIVGQSFDDFGATSVGTDVERGQIIIDLRPAEDREDAGLMSSSDFIAALRARLPPLPGVNKLEIASRQGGPPGKPIEVEIKGRDLGALRDIAERMKSELATYQGTVDIEDSLDPGKREARVELLPGAENLGLTTAYIATQLRGAYYGAEAQRFQRDRDEVKIMVRLEEAERDTLDSLDDLRIRTPAGGRVPLREVASVQLTRGLGTLYRINGLPAVKVTSGVDRVEGNASEIRASLDGVIAELQDKNPGVTFAYSGEQLETAKSLGSLVVGFPVALIMIYVLLAVQFSSYVQPLIIMMAIPFGIVGAIWGHLLMDFPMTVLSMIGVVALSGIVVNDSIVLVDFVNHYVRDGHTLHEAVVKGGQTRLRPILLTSATTIFGLAPLIFFERSFQAQFLIPMAVSICFGLLFATIITLFLVPVLYLVLEDVRTIVHWFATGRWERPEALAHRQTTLMNKIVAGYESHYGTNWQQTLAERQQAEETRADEARTHAFFSYGAADGEGEGDAGSAAGGINGHDQTGGAGGRAPGEVGVVGDDDSSPR
jgi:multidrug efflux pump subunit AcrB